MVNKRFSSSGILRRI